MKITTSLIPELVWYTHYEWCTIKDALLYELRNNPDNVLPLPRIGKIKVNWNKLLWSYWKAIETLKKEGYQIENVVYHDVKKHITRSIYILKNPTYSGSIQD